MKRTTALLLTLAMLLALCLAGCGGSAATDTAAPAADSGDAAPAADADAPAEAAPAAEAGEPVYGGSATIYYKNFNSVFDPAMAESYTYSLWLESLWGPDWGLNDPSQYNFDANVLPLKYIAGQIADSWDWVKNGDGTSDLHVTIRDDVYFQEKDAAYDVFGGRNLTADDVKFSYDRILGTGEGGSAEMASYEISWTSLFAGVLDFTYPSPVEVEGDYQVVFHLASEAESVLETFMYTAVNITGVEWDTLSEEQRNDWHYACGTGPFVLVGYEPDSYYKYERNANYYDFDERHPENRLPYLDSLTLTAVQDAASIQASFIAGNLDYISLDANLTPDQTQQIADALGGDLQVIYLDSNAAGIALKVNQEPFSDIRVRVALQKAVNLEQVNAAYYGYETPLNLAGLWIAPRSEWSSIPEWDAELLDEYTYDPEGAKALLAEAGYPDGFAFTVALDTNADQDLYLLIKSYFAAIGVTMELDPVADMQAAHQISGDSSNPEQINQNIADLESFDSAIFMYGSTGFANPTFHTDTEFDAMLANAQAALTNDEAAQYAKAGTTLKTELLQSRIGGLANGERISYSSFTKPFLARIWAIDGQ